MRRNLKRIEEATLRGRYGNDQGWDVVKTLVNGGASTSRLLELYYWTREPGMVELIRAYLDLPDHAQRGLRDFLLNGWPQSIRSSFDTQGRLVLSRTNAPADLARHRPNSLSR